MHVVKGRLLLYLEKLSQTHDWLGKINQRSSMINSNDRKFKKIIKKSTPCNRGTPIIWVTPTNETPNNTNNRPVFIDESSMTLSLEGLGVTGLLQGGFPSRSGTTKKDRNDRRKPEFLVCTVWSLVSLGWSDFQGKCCLRFAKFTH